MTMHYLPSHLLNSVHFELAISIVRYFFHQTIELISFRLLVNDLAPKDYPKGKRVKISYSFVYAILLRVKSCYLVDLPHQVEPRSLGESQH
jgi:hypothetical protein